MKIINKPFPHVSIDNFIPNSSLVRAASESFSDVKDWVRYGGGEDTLDAGGRRAVHQCD